MIRAASIGISLGLIVATGMPASAQHHVNPVTINPGGGSTSGLNLNISPTTYVYGSSGYHGSNRYYGGFPGVYGVPYVVSSGGWNFPGTGFYGNGYGGGYGLGAGYGYGAGFASYGFGPGTYGDFNGVDPAVQQQQYALATSRYQMENAQATEAYARANLLQQQAIAAAIKNGQAAPTPPIRERYNARTTRPRGAAHPATAEPSLPLDKLLAKDNAVLWPVAAPKDATRDDFGAAMATLAKEYQDAGKVDVQDVNAARDALHAYGVPALAKVRREHPTQGPALKTFLNSLDATITDWAK